MARLPGLVHFIGGLGLLALALALAATVYFRVQTSPNQFCALGPTSAKAASFAITDVQPVDLRLGGTLCLTVENVVTVDAVKRADEAIASAKALEAGAKAELKAAQEASFATPQTLTPVQVQAQIQVKTAQLAAAQAELKARTEERQALGQSRTFFLYVNGAKSPLKTIARGVAEPQALALTLEHSTDAATEVGRFWRQAVAMPVAKGKVDANLALGEADNPPTPFATRPGEIRKIVLYTGAVRLLALFAMFAILTWLIALAINTSLLRDGTDNKSTFSLARVQMMCWLVLVTGGFVYIWIVTGQFLNVVNTTTFALLGISGVAAGAAQAIDRQNKGPSPPAIPRTRGFIADLATDPNGEIQLHRLQMILWTVILGLIFFWQFAARLEFVDFDANLLALAGIVNGVYVGLKTQEP